MLSRSLSMKHINLRLNARKAKVLAVFTLLSGAAAYKVATDEGIQRSLKVQRRALVPLVKYRYYDWKTKGWPQEKRDAIFQVLHETYAPIVADTLLEMKGFYIKFGQLISGGDGLVPKEYSDALKVLQDSCPYRPIKDIIVTLEQELGKPFHEVFLSIDPVPLGSASIGQVHKARLLSGEVVAVKVQHPDAERFFRADVATSRAITALAQPEQLVVFNEIEKQFVSEFDYTLEAKNLQDVYDASKVLDKFRDSIVIPKPLMATKRMLIMTFVDGETLYKKQRKYLRQLAESQNKSEELIEQEMKAKVEKGEFPEPPSQKVLMAYRSALRARDYIRNGVALAYNVAFGKWTGAPIDYVWADLPMNAQQSLQFLYEFFGYTLFEHGIFSSDPHGGNVMHVKGEKLGLIDMGQLKRLDENTRIKFAKLIVKLADDDGSTSKTEEIAQAFRDCGIQTKHNNTQVIADMARLYFDRLTDDLIDRYGQVAVMIENMAKIDPVDHLPDDMIMPMRASMMLRMNAMGLGYGFTGGIYSRVSPVWEPYARDFLQKQGLQEFKPKKNQPKKAVQLRFPRLDAPKSTSAA